MTKSIFEREENLLQNSMLHFMFKVKSQLSEITLES